MNVSRINSAALCLSVGAVVAAAVAPGLGPVQQGQQHRRSTDPPTMSRGNLGPELFMAVGRRDDKGVDDLIGRGADVNARNGLEFTPLYLASATFQMGVMGKLIKAGADVNADSPYGTALLFAGLSGNAPGAQILLANGADVNASRADGKTALMNGANAGSVPFVQEMIAHKAAVDTTDTSGATALTYAARGGHVQVGQILIEHGADVDHADEEGLTPLLMAAMNGHADFVKMLLNRGAKVDAKDKSGRDALVLAATYGDYPGVVENLRSRSGSVAAAGAVAARRGHTATAKLLGAKAPASAVPTARRAVAASVKAIEKSMKTFADNAACVSCHHEGLGRMATAVAKANGFATSAELDKVQAQRVGMTVTALKPLNEDGAADPRKLINIPLAEVNEVTPGYTWMLVGMVAKGEKADAGRVAMTKALGAFQAPDGSWSFGLPRAPMQSSLFTYTALSVRALTAYAPDKGKVALAAKWLAATPAKTLDDKAFKVLGLKWAGAPAKDVRAAAADLATDQHADGGWASASGVPSDAYGTSLALYALGKAGTPVTSPAYAKGAKFLLRNQDPDGTWYVVKRAIPANNYMEAGFPHGESQYSSFIATCYATMALAPMVKR
ncbi:MAG: ankyrin repeat domain-containing protein [Fimbriimonadaceae bacterium]|nr:ankyrin repeat domain-containing protein [Fimbriimonadaceae bacterium]